MKFIKQVEYWAKAPQVAKVAGESVRVSGVKRARPQTEYPKGRWKYMIRNSCVIGWDEAKSERVDGALDLGRRAESEGHRKMKEDQKPMRPDYVSGHIKTSDMLVYIYTDSVCFHFRRLQSTFDFTCFILLMSGYSLVGTYQVIINNNKIYFWIFERHAQVKIKILQGLGWNFKLRSWQELPMR